MISALKLTPMFASRPVVLRRAVVSTTIARAAAPESSEPTDPEAIQKPEAAEKPIVNSFISPVTGNPQTGKLIDLYFEFGAILAIVVLSFWSMYNVRDVVDQTGNADAFRQPAPKTEWLALDNQDVRPHPPNHRQL